VALQALSIWGPKLWGKALRRRADVRIMFMPAAFFHQHWYGKQWELFKILSLAPDLFFSTLCGPRTM